ncbi:MAG: class IV adenylate cyclase [Chloroflexi bacterium]|nr:class IV adenylate cyclase [Chloroflexota bacterium]
MKDMELEIKYYIADLDGLERRLQSLGAKLAHPRVHEVNLRFDLPDGSLRERGSVLRLRQDESVHLTYKGPSFSQGEVRARQEIEFIADDFRTARAFLEALGYRVVLMYEKYRTGYEFMDTFVTLDVMPYGTFAEIEGPDPETIRAANQALGLNWSARLIESYTVLFEMLKARARLDFVDLSFANFAGLPPSLSLLDIRPADQQ